jgi:ABC-type nitrate/sulfonate/bicarbonate transport system ATPase subunit
VGCKLEKIDRDAWGLGVVLEHVHERYCKRWALADVSLTVRAGDLVTIGGPPANGSGALLRLIADRRQPQSGAVRLVGQPTLQAIDSEIFQARSIARLTGAGSLLDTLSVAANVEGPLMAAERRWEERRERVTVALRRAGLCSVANRPVGMLSGEQRARVRLTMALVTRPRLLLVDALVDGWTAALARDALALSRDLSGCEHEPTVIIAARRRTGAAKGCAVETSGAIELPYRAITRGKPRARRRATVLAGDAPRSLRAVASR